MPADPEVAAGHGDIAGHFLSVADHGEAALCPSRELFLCHLASLTETLSVRKVRQF